MAVLLLLTPKCQDLLLHPAGVYIISRLYFLFSASLVCFLLQLFNSQIQDLHIGARWLLTALHSITLMWVVISQARAASFPRTRAKCSRKGLEGWLSTKSTGWSSWGPEFSFQHPHEVAHNCLWLQFHGDLMPSLVSTGTYTRVHITDTDIHINKNIRYKKRLKRSCLVLTWFCAIPGQLLWL